MAYFDGAERQRLSTFPTREEAEPSRRSCSHPVRLMGGALSPGRNVLGIVKELQERLEKGQAIEKRA